MLARRKFEADPWWRKANWQFSEIKAAGGSSPKAVKSLLLPQVPLAIHQNSTIVPQTLQGLVGAACWCSHFAAGKPWYLGAFVQAAEYNKATTADR